MQNRRTAVRISQRSFFEQIDLATQYDGQLVLHCHQVEQASIGIRLKRHEYVDVAVGAL